MNFSENLRELRKAKDIKQEVLAENLNVSRQTVSKWENGTAMPDLKKLTALAEYFGVTMDELLGLTSPGSEGENISDYAKEYINELISLENEASTKKINDLNTKWKISVIILAVVLAIAFFNIGNLSTRLTAAENNMQNIANNTYYNNDDSNDELDSTSYKILNYVDYKVLDIDKSKPWLATISITYSPEKYSKNLKVTFNAPQEDGTIKEVELENNNGDFTVQTTVDTTYDKYIIQTNDGETIEKADLSIDFIDDYFNSDSISIPANYSDGYITGELDDYINFRIVSKAKVKKGYVKAYFDDEKPYFTKEFRVYNDKLYVSSVKIKTSFDKFYKHNTFNLEYVAVDENGIEYSTIQKLTFSINGNKIDLDNCDEISKKITFPNGKTITSPTDE